MKNILTREQLHERQLNEFLFKKDKSYKAGAEETIDGVKFTKPSDNYWILRQNGRDCFGSSNFADAEFAAFLYNAGVELGYSTLENYVKFMGKGKEMQFIKYKVEKEGVKLEYPEKGARVKSKDNETALKWIKDQIKKNGYVDDEHYHNLDTEQE